MKPVSAVIITKNEEDNLKLLLPKLSWCDEIVVVDDFSVDNTLEVCELYSCKTAQRKLDGFGEQKNFAVSLANNNWIFSIDADELPTQELIDEIKQVLSQNVDNLGGYAIRRNHIFMKRIFKYSSESKIYFLRLFDKTKAAFNNNRVHETVVTKYPVAKLTNGMLHNSYRDLEHYIEKMNHYSTLAAQSYADNGKTKNIVLVMLSTPFLFIKNYFFDLNCMEGLPGFFWAFLNNWYRIMKYVKLKEITIIRNNKLKNKEFSNQ